MMTKIQARQKVSSLRMRRRLCGIGGIASMARDEVAVQPTIGLHMTDGSLKAQPNKTDRNDARGTAQMIRG